MRIYGLEDSLDKFVNDKKFQIEIIGEDGCWTYKVSLKEWSDILQRYVHEAVAEGTCMSFLGAYDAIAQTIASHNK